MPSNAFVEHLDVGDLADATAHVGRQRQCGVQQFMPVSHHLPSPAVERRVDRHAGAGGHQQVGARPEPIPVDEITLDVVHRALFEAGPILCTLTTQTSAPASIAQVGRSSWKGR